MDDVDRAQLFEERDRDNAIKAMLKMNRQKQLIINGRAVCIDCKNPLSDLRLKAAPDASRCVPCQAAIEVS